MSLNCYNKGCGQKFEAVDNTEESCHFHPGVPVFHDAYKGWSCCKKKSINFTEFLNFKGCTTGKHSEEKPEVQEKSQQSEVDLDSIIHKAQPSTPIQTNVMKRPSFDAPLVTIQPIVNPTFKQQIDSLDPSNSSNKSKINGGEVDVGTACKRGGCTVTYESVETNRSDCVHHPGVPIFHEGCKFWSCCKKRTSDFQAFLNQVGCTTGKHLWHKVEDSSTVKCKWDWHQTASSVVVVIYAKMYDYARSYVKLNPIHLEAKLVFPQQNNQTFSIDLELRGIVDVSTTSVKMFGTKLEISMQKAEPGSWSNLNFPQEKLPTEQAESKTDERARIMSMTDIKTKKMVKEDDDSSDSDFLDDVDLITRTAKITELD